MEKNFEKQSFNSNHKDYIRFNFNNWLKDENHPVLKKLKEKGGAIYMNLKGEISYRLSSNDPYITTKDYKGLSNIFSNYLGMEVDFSPFNKKIKNIEEIDENSLVKPEDLILVSAETFNPKSNNEFLKSENATYFLNKFKPSYYMQFDCNKIAMANFNIERTIIFDFILHLVNYNKRRAYWVINWLAYFFQELKKAQVALVLIGVQGTGKNILFNQIIKPLWGKAFTKTINDKSLNTKYKGALVENVLFLNLDELSVNTSLTESQKNFIKALVTNLSATLEKKFKNLEQETLLNAQILITSNEVDALEIESNDRRFTVFSTGETLLNTNFLDLDCYETFSEALESELEKFACYLKNYSVNVEMANTALSTPEKDEMIYQYQIKQQLKVAKQQKILQPKLTKLQKNLDEYAYCIKNKEIEFFESIRFADEELFQTVYSDFCNNVFRVENLLPAYKALYGSYSIKTNSELLRELQKVDYWLFNTRNIGFYKINGLEKECLNLLQHLQRRY